MKSLSRIAGVASAFPPHSVDRTQATAVLTRLFPDEDPGFVANLVERSGIAERRLARPVSEVLERKDFTERNRRYRSEALELALGAARGALDAAALDAAEVDVLIDVSCTGIAIPALDVAMSPELGLRPQVTRIPIAESGCAAGALGLGLADAYARAGKTVLVVAVELSSLTLTEDRSRTNLVAAVLFGDGATAAIVRPGASAAGAGEDGACPRPRIRACSSYLIPNSQEAMGFDVGTHGLRILLQRELPVLVRENLVPVVEAFLAANDRSRNDVGLHLIHPGGRRILDAYEELFTLAPDALRLSRASMRRFGNLSSASVLNVLELALEEGARVAPDQCALLLGVGPGISLELTLFDWPVEGR
ncbi:MAG: type III polyketide synthase [Planctomycetes bacterium]|nr:type III polyketide synthase [Planctomycetota bacterium]